MRNKGRRDTFVLITIMAVIVILVEVISIALLYRAAFNEERVRLRETVQSQAELMGAIARFDTIHSPDYPGGAVAATISQVEDAHDHYDCFGENGEFTMAKLEGDQIVFLLRHWDDNHNLPQPVPIDSGLAEPMRRALAGESGTLIGLDYRGVKVLAAHEPVHDLGVGIVAKIDLAEIRAPFISAGIGAILVGAFVIAIGAILFYRITTPLLLKLSDSERRFRLLYNTGQKLSKTLEMEEIYTDFYNIICESMPCDSLVVASFDPDDSLIRCEYNWHDGRQMDVSGFPPIPLEPEGRGTQSKVIRTGESMLIADYQQLLKKTTTAYSITDKGEVVDPEEVPDDVDVTRSALIVPIVLEGQVRGVIQVLSYKLNAYTDDHLLLLESLAAQIAVAHNNALLYQQAQVELQEREKAEQKVLVSEQKLKALTRNIVIEQEAERRRISANLHDQAGQALTALKIELSLLKDFFSDGDLELQNELQTLDKYVDKAHDHLRLVTRNLWPVALDTLGLDATLEGLCEHLAENSPIAVHYQGEPVWDVPENVKISFFRVAEEALANASRHADARSVWMKLQHNDPQLALVITDDGKGFDPEILNSHTPGLGLISMRERMEMIDGALEIQSSENGGTTITAVWPMED